MLKKWPKCWPCRNETGRSLPANSSPASTTPWPPRRKRRGRKSFTVAPAKSRKAKSVAARWNKSSRASAPGSVRVVVHPEAGQELAAAALWHEERQPGLGSIFLDEFEATLRRVAAEPERWRKMRAANPHLNSLRSPFPIVYPPR